MPGIVLLTERRVRNKFIGTLYYAMNYETIIRKKEFIFSSSLSL